MPKNYNYDETFDKLIDQDQLACEWAETELANLLERESGQYLDQITQQPEATATGLEQFISSTLSAIAHDRYSDPFRAYQMTKTILEYVVAGTFNSNPFRSTMTYPGGGTRHGRLSVADTGIQIGVFHTTQEPEQSAGIKRFGESAMERNEDTMRLLGALASTMGMTEIDDSFTSKLPPYGKPVPVTDLVTGDQVLATLHQATRDIDIIVRPTVSQQHQKVA